MFTRSELVLQKQNIGVSDGDSTPPEISKLPPLIEVGVLIKKIKQKYLNHVHFFLMKIFLRLKTHAQVL